MEHRMSSRTLLNMNVAIYYNGLGLLQGRTRDVSRHGMYVETGLMTLPLHALVDVAFPLSANAISTPPQRASAMVVRLTDCGAGLMFSEEFYPAE